MKVLGGQNKGRILKTVRSNAIRPSLARVRKSLFDILGSNVIDAKVLDLFAGAGTLGIEALSRGADHVLFMDSSKESLKIIRSNLETCRLLDKADMILDKIPEGLSRIGENRFTVIFVDAPYEKGLTEPALNDIGRAILLEKGAFVIARVSRREELLDHYGEIVLKTMRSYGDSKLYFFEY